MAPFSFMKIKTFILLASVTLAFKESLEKEVK